MLQLHSWERAMPIRSYSLMTRTQRGNRPHPSELCSTALCILYASCRSENLHLVTADLVRPHLYGLLTCLLVIQQRPCTMM